MRSALRCLLAFAFQILGLTAAFAQGGQSTATGISRAFNPAISANGLFLGGYTKREDPEGAATASTGLHVQEMEMQLTAFVDASLKADLIVSLPGGEGLEMEEGFVTTQGLPHNLLLKAGKFYAEFGRHNLLHTHQFPFLDPPLVLERLFGEEGLNEVGISLSALLPVPWYMEVSGQILNGDNPLWVNPTDEDLLYLGHLKNFWDLGDAATLELGGSWAGGRNVTERFTSVTGADLTLKWRPPRRALYRGLTWQTEYLYARENLKVEYRKRGGLYSLLQYQFARRWWAQARYDRFGLPEETGWEDRFSGLLALVPSEFSALRFQYSRWRVERAGRGFNQFHLQLNFTIGSHPAHKY